jgi:hypothetical protein
VTRAQLAHSCVRRSRGRECRVDRHRAAGRGPFTRGRRQHRVRRPPQGRWCGSRCWRSCAVVVTSGAQTWPRSHTSAARSQSCVLWLTGARAGLSLSFWARPDPVRCRSDSGPVFDELLAQRQALARLRARHGLSTDPAYDEPVRAALFSARHYADHAPHPRTPQAEEADDELTPELAPAEPVPEAVAPVAVQDAVAAPAEVGRAIRQRVLRV